MNMTIDTLMVSEMSNEQAARFTAYSRPGARKYIFARGTETVCRVAVEPSGTYPVIVVLNDGETRRFATKVLALAWIREI